MKILIDDKIPFIKGVFEPFAEVVYMPSGITNREMVRDADAMIIRTRTICNQELLEGSKVKFIATATIGYDHIDTKWCEANGIIWRNAAGCNSSSVMQYVASTLVHLSKKHKFNLADRTLGVVGVGNVGFKVVKLAEALGMRVVLNDPPITRKRGECGYVSLDGLIREADIITLHVPLQYEGDDKTYHLFDEKQFQKLNPGTILINSSRGEVVDNVALRNVLKTGHLQGAVLDVWENEPNIDLELLSLLDIATPHIAGYSADGKANGTAMSVKAISKYFRLGLNDWFPTEIPQPAITSFLVNCTGKSELDILFEAIEATYKVADDDSRLRANVSTFENQRGNYPLRREFPAYTIELKNGINEFNKALKQLGFNVL
jgi:erythronate-4-phosphate dehydrogenase